MSQKIAFVEAQCSRCGGTGIYRSEKEPKDVGIVCCCCCGSGKELIRYTPFHRRQRRDDVKKVYLPHSWAGIGDIESPVTYQEFLKGKLPEIKRASYGF